MATNQTSPQEYTVNLLANRKARVGENICTDEDGNKPFAVFRHTLYNNKWYYDGYTPFATKDEADAAMQRWLNGEAI